MSTYYIENDKWEDIDLNLAIQVAEVKYTTNTIYEVNTRTIYGKQASGWEKMFKANTE